jgi:hypothetical protein
MQTSWRTNSPTVPHFPSRRTAPWPTILREEIREIVYTSLINVLIVFVPFAFISVAYEWSPQAAFFSNFLALMPRAAPLSYGTETTGKVSGSLLNVKFGIDHWIVLPDRSSLLRRQFWAQFFQFF